MKDAIDDLEAWKSKLELLLKSQMVNQQLNERTEITRNTNTTIHVKHRIKTVI
jgi:hypothetical protein